MRLTLRTTEREVAAAAAERVAEVLAADAAAVLGLPTGRTPMRLYRLLARLGDEGALDFGRATTFNLDEFLGIGPDHPGSYHAYMRQHLFAHVNLPSARAHLLRGDAADPERECERYETDIEAAGGIDLQLLGIGANGHIGFNEPGPCLCARTHRAMLRPSTRRANALFFGGNAEAVPQEALSMGMGTILKARRIVLMATGKSKARAVARIVSGPLTTRLPASFLQLHRHVELICDRAAAALISDE
ncbi:MAG: glucosamine-6-phosphate deaminase [Luteitalea sp.]|nr:glucosamine-6-phosphate deaminase [Luteitalea sp.]